MPACSLEDWTAPNEDGLQQTAVENLREGALPELPYHFNLDSEVELPQKGTRGTKEKAVDSGLFFLDHSSVG